MSSKKAPWNIWQVKRLAKVQKNKYRHPYTCGFELCRRDLVPTVSGWRCICGYKQDWALAEDIGPKKDVLNGTMIKKLMNFIENDFSDMIKDNSLWDTIVVNKRKPHTYRAFTYLPNGDRVCLHRFDPCEENEAFFHPHPWPGAFLVIDGEYRMKTGFYKNRKTKKPEIIMDSVLSEGSTYEMMSPLGGHSVQPVTQCWSIMINGKPWDKKVAHQNAPTTKGKDLEKMSNKHLGDHLTQFMMYDLFS